MQRDFRETHEQRMLAPVIDDQRGAGWLEHSIELLKGGALLVGRNVVNGMEANYRITDIILQRQVRNVSQDVNAFVA